MDTEFTIFESDLIDKIYESGGNFEFLDSDIKILNDFIESVRHVLSIEQIFNSYLFNFCNLHNSYELFFNDVIKKNTSLNFIYDISDEISINALTNNLISSAITLINSMEIFIKELCDKNFISSYDTVKSNWLSRMYDTNFSYRFFYMLRHFTQHSNLAVSIDKNINGKKYCYFDLWQIVNDKHFNMNSKLKEELIEIMEKMIKGPHEHVHLTYVGTVANYHVTIIELYCQYYDIIDDSIKNINENCNELVASKKDIICKSIDELNGMILYLDDNMFHAFYPSPFFHSNKLQEFKKYAKNILIKEKNELKKFKIIPLP